MVDTEFVMKFGMGTFLDSEKITFTEYFSTISGFNLLKFPLMTQLREFWMKVVSKRKRVGSRLLGQHGLSW